MKQKRSMLAGCNILSGKFLICILGTVLLCGFGQFPGSAGYKDEISLFAWLRYSQNELLAMGENASAYSVMVSFHDMEWFAVLMPLLASFPAVTDFAGQWSSGYYYPSISRKTRRKYAAGWMLRAAFAGFACIVSGICIYFILAWFKFPHFEEFGLDTESSMIAMAYGTTAGKRFLTLVVKVFHTGLLAAILAMGSIAFTVVCCDGFFAISSLTLLEYFSIKLSSAYEGWMFTHFYNQGREETMPSKIVRFFFPSNHLYYDQSFTYQYGVGYWLYLIFAVLLAVGIWLWFYRMVKKRDG